MKEREIMKQCLLITALLICVVGCQYSGPGLKGYLDDPSTILEDPLSVQHQDQLDDLESSYLKKEISYAEYIEQKQRLENDFVRDVRKREGRSGY